MLTTKHLGGPNVCGWNSQKIIIIIIIALQKRYTPVILGSMRFTNNVIYTYRYSDTNLKHVHNHKYPKQTKIDDHHEAQSGTE